MARSSCGLSCNPSWPPDYRYLDLVFAFMGTIAFLVDLVADVWVVASYLKAGNYYWGGLVLGLMVLSSVTTQIISGVWYCNDHKEQMQQLPATLVVLHILHLGYLYRCFQVLKVGFHVCQTKAAEDKERSYAFFLSHDISLLRLFETFLENAPQLTLVVYIILHTSKAEIFQVLGICTSSLCIVWALLDYHQTLRSFLWNKHKLDRPSSVLYFLWNFLLVCPRILCLALFMEVFSNYIFLHFLGVWSAMLLWVTLQNTDLMEHAIFEWLYRAVVAIILYFCWFNVAEGRTLCRAVIYHTFILVDSVILATSWLWNSASSESNAYLVPALYAALSLYIPGIVLRIVYYRYCHPSLQAALPAAYDEVDHGEPMNNDTTAFRQLDLRVRRDHVNPRTYKLAQSFFSWDVQHQQNGTLGDIPM